MIELTILTIGIITSYVLFFLKEFLEWIKNRIPTIKLKSPVEPFMGGHICKNCLHYECFLRRKVIFYCLKYNGKIPYKRTLTDNVCFESRSAFYKSKEDIEAY